MDNKPRLFGYARVSTRHQNEDRQLQALEEVPIPPQNIYVDKQSGKDFERDQYQKLLEKLRTNDVLYIKSIDRLGRNYREIIHQWKILTQDLGVDVVVIDMPLLDTRRGKDLLGTFISDVVLQILSFVAENERDSILQRQKEGIAIARANGVRFGRPKRPLPDNFREIAIMWRSGLITSVAGAKLCNLPLTTFRSKAMEIEFQRKKRRKKKKRNDDL